MAKFLQKNTTFFKVEQKRTFITGPWWKATPYRKF